LPSVKPIAKRQFAGLVVEQTERGVSGDLFDGIGVGLGDLFDFDATFGGGGDNDLLAGAIHDDAEVDFVDIGDGFSHEDFLNGQPFDVHAKDLASHQFGFGGGLRQLDAARFTAATDEYSALTTTGAPIWVAMARTSAGVMATPPPVTGIPYLAQISRAWYSCNFIAKSLRCVSIHRPILPLPGDCVKKYRLLRCIL
jgi:hypothetical protein